MNTLQRSLFSPNSRLSNNKLKTFLCIGIIMLFVIAPIAQAECPPVHIFTAEEEYNRFGYTVASAGDVNNDGYGDIIVGAYQFGISMSTRGRAYVFSGFNGDTLYVFTGEATGDRLGHSVASAGDVNNDGYDDIIVGADLSDHADSSAGSAYVFSGLNGDTLYIFSGAAAGDRLGASVASAGDVNNDGFSDLIIGAPGRNIDGIHNGWVYVFSGLNGDTLHIFTGEANKSSTLGWPAASIASAGDVNNDGFDDLIIGSQYNNTNGLYAGRAFVFSGFDGDTLYVFTAEKMGSYFGGSVASAGDIDNDGFDDMVIGAAQYGNVGDAHSWVGALAGRAYVFSGQTGDTLYVFTGQDGSRLGHSVTSAGDINNDGYVDLLVGAYRNSTAGSGTGAVFVFSGLDGDTLFSIKNEATSGRFGWSVASTGTVNENGFADLIIGDYGSGTGGGVFIQRTPLTDPSLCVGNTGNVDADPCDNVDIADLTVLIDHLFINFPPLVSPLEGNVDGDDAGVIDIADLTLLIDHLFINFPSTAVCQ